MDSSVKNSEMENATPRRRSFRPVIFIALVLVIVGVFVIILINKKPAESAKSSQPETVAKTEENKEDKKAEEKKSEEPAVPSEPEAVKEEEIIEDQSPVKLDGEDPNTSNELTGVINYAESDGETVMIRATINQYLESGACVLDLTSTDDSFNLTDQITPSASTSTCSFDIATSLLNSGKYNIKITLSSEGKKGIIEGEVDV